MTSHDNGKGLETDPAFADDLLKRINETAQPCPYCGDGRLGSDLQTTDWAIICESCGARGPAVNLQRLTVAETPDSLENIVHELLAIWNQRKQRHSTPKIHKHKYRPVSDDEKTQLIFYATRFFSHTQRKIFKLASDVDIHPASLRLALRFMDKLCAIGKLDDPRLRPEYFDVVEELDVNALVDDILKNAEWVQDRRDRKA